MIMNFHLDRHLQTFDYIYNVHTIMHVVYIYEYIHGAVCL